MEKLLEKEKGIDSKRASKRGPLLDLLIHDLTGPLSVVSKSAVNLSQKESRFGPLTAQQKRLVDRILRNVRKAQTLLNQRGYCSDQSRGDRGSVRGSYPSPPIPTR